MGNVYDYETEYLPTLQTLNRLVTELEKDIAYLLTVSSAKELAHVAILVGSLTSDTGDYEIFRKSIQRKGHSLKDIDSLLTKMQHDNERAMEETRRNE